jgi:hypothetical protein
LKLKTLRLSHSPTIKPLAVAGVVLSSHFQW